MPLVFLKMSSSSSDDDILSDGPKDPTMPTEPEGPKDPGTAQASPQAATQ